jgi:hypothetical protein
MVDWFVVVTPLVLVPVALFVFVGCVGDEPVAPTTEPPAPADGATQTHLQLNVSRDLQTNTPSADPRKVEKIVVYWSLWKSGGVWDVVPSPHDVMVSSDPAYAFLDPVNTAAPRYTMTAPEVTGTDQVSCTCQVTMRLADPANPSQADPSDPEQVINVDSDPFPLMVDRNHVFTLTPKPPTPTQAQREFSLTFQTADGG